MELCGPVVEGIEVAGSSSLDEKTFQQLVSYALRSILEPETCSTHDEGEQLANRKAH